MKQMQISGNKIVFVDDDDFDALNKNKWTLQITGNSMHAFRRHKKVKVWMHRQIMRAPEGIMVDHIDGNGLNNCKSNLRFATAQNNQHNMRLPKHNTSGFKGVSFRKKTNRKSKFWEASICINKKKKHLGCFNTAEEAALAYDIAAASLFGKFANLNFKKGVNNE